MKTFVFALALTALGAFAADDTQQCKADCREFVAHCERGCDQQQKKDPKALAVCKKNCNDFVRQCEKGCD